MQTQPDRLGARKVHIYLGSDGEKIKAFYAALAAKLRRSASWLMVEALKHDMERIKRGAK